MKECRSESEGSRSNKEDWSLEAAKTLKPRDAGVRGRRVKKVGRKEATKEAMKEARKEEMKQEERREEHHKQL